MLVIAGVFVGLWVMWVVVLSLAWDMLRHWFVSYRSNAGSEASVSGIVKPPSLGRI